MSYVLQQINNKMLFNSKNGVVIFFVNEKARCVSVNGFSIKTTKEEKEKILFAKLGIKPEISWLWSESDSTAPYIGTHFAFPNQTIYISLGCWNMFWNTCLHTIGTLSKHEGDGNENATKQKV